MEFLDSRQNRSDLLRAASTLAACLSDQGRFAEADGYYTQAIEVAEELASDEDNIESQQKLAEIYNNYGLCFNTQGDYSSADRYYTLSAEVYRRIMERTGSAYDAAHYALSLLNTGENAFKDGDQSRSREYFERGLTVYGEVYESLGAYDTAQFYAWQSYYELVHLRDYDAALTSALNGWQYQPDSVLVNLNLAYACLYDGYTDDAMELFSQIAALGEGQIEAIRLDLEAQQRAGMESAFYDDVMLLLSSAS